MAVMVQNHAPPSGAPLLAGRNTDIVGEPLDYALLDEDRLVALVRERLATHRMAAVRHFPADPDALLRVVRNFGEPLLRFGRPGTTAMDYIGDVRYRPDITADKRLVTQGNEELAFHTARAYAPRRPAYFAMLMVEPGWTDQGAGRNGESLLARWQDVVDEFRERFPATAEEDLRLLSGVAVAYKPWFAPIEPANEPVLFRMPEGDVGVRYWESMLATANEWIGGVADGERYLTALSRFDATANACARAVEYQMEPRQLIVVDNNRVAHARRPFVASRVDAQGNTEFNPRWILSVYVQ